MKYKMIYETKTYRSLITDYEKIFSNESIVELKNAQVT